MMVLTFSEQAIAKIFNDARMIGDVRGHEVVPILIRYLDRYSSDANGRRIDHGPGFILDFKSAKEPIREPYVDVFTPDGRAIFIDPASFPSSGRWTLDYQDRTFFLGETA